MEEGYSIGDVMLVFFGMLTGAMSLSVAANNVEFFAKARVAAHEIFTLIDRVTPIDALSEDGLKLPVQNIKAEISLKNISFTYPARLDHQVLHNVSFSANEGETVALCGQSGCGKSTCIQLIQRFYDPQEGGVYLGGHDIKTLNVKFLRDMIGVVSQEPILFETTIIENIRYGRLDVTDAEIKQAAKQANAYDFIQNLPKQWDTEVGEGGATLSGGQKQRVAIARALVRNPKILLLDEATSALDTESESIVQAALEKASEGRTTIVIAHRLSTIRSADKIFGFAGGRIVEEGTHKSLLEIENGVYANLCNMQTFEKAAPSEKAKESKKKVVLDRQKSQNQDKEEEKEDLPTSPWSKIMAMNGPETPYIVVGIFFAAITGAAQPLFAVVFAEILTIFSDDLSDEEMTAEINKAVIAFVILGGVNFVGNIGAISCFGKSGEELTKRIRSKEEL